MRKGILSLIFILMPACSKNTQDFEKRIDAAIKLCQSDSTRAYSQTLDGLRIMCDDGSSYLIRNDLSLEEIVELDQNYCSSMGIRDFVAEKDGAISLTCKDGANYIL